MRASAIATSLAVALGLGLAAARPVSGQPARAEDESTALVDEGRRDLKRGELDDAARALDQAIALNPRRIEAYVLRAGVHLARKEYAAGIALVRRARALAPDNDDVGAMLGTLLTLDGQDGEGVPLLAAAAAKDPGRYEAHALLARHYAGAAEWPRAIAELEAYLRSRPAPLAGDDDAYRIDLADAYLRDRQARRAAELFAAAAKARPRDVRARLGLAWATAALDCARARPMLAALADLAPRHPEIGLVDGQCALALGAIDDAIARGRGYLEVVPAAAAGHGLVGAARLARGEIAEARAELAEARKLEPASRRWAVKLAETERRTGDAAAAVATLREIGAPAEPTRDRAWWRELAEALLADGKRDAVVDEVGPVAAALAEPGVLAAVGEAELGRGRAAAAVPWLEQAERAGATPRARRLLAHALDATGVAKLGAGDLAGAEADLARATALGKPGAADAIVPAAAWRNLGVVRLAAGRDADAVTALEAAVLATPDGATWMLLARARAAAGDAAAARQAYGKALAAGGADAVAIAIDAAAFELGAGDAAAAVAALEKIAAPRGDARYAAAIETARHAAGLAALRAGQGGRAIALLEAAQKDAAGDEARAVACDLALATVAGGDRDVALRRLRALGSAPCPFPAPADVQAVPILTALNEGLRPHGAAAALPRLVRLEKSATGAARALLATAIRAVAIAGADEAYRGGKLPEAQRLLAAALAVESRVGADELAQDRAVLDVEAGRYDAAIAALEKLGARVPDALVELGIAYDRHGEPAKALDAWRRARKAGSRWPALGDWIAAKERIWGGAPEEGTP